MAPLPEEEESLWWLTAGPGLWAVHFGLSYATVAVWCGKFAGRDGDLSAARLAIGAYTLVALAGIGWTAWKGWKRHRYGGTETVPHDFDTPEDRHRFLGFATLILAGLSAVATLYVAFVVVFLRSCH